jgi:hypothetical protein
LTAEHGALLRREYPPSQLNLTTVHKRAVGHGVPEQSSSDRHVTMTGERRTDLRLSPVELGQRPALVDDDGPHRRPEVGVHPCG